MNEVFLTVLSMSLTASYVIILVILVRLLLKKAPKAISYALWGVAAFRLLIPFSFESMFSLIPRNMRKLPIPHDIIYQQSPQRINSGIKIVDSFVNQTLPVSTIETNINPLQNYVGVAAYIWVLGIIVLLVYSLISIMTLNGQLKNAQLIEKNTFEAGNLKTPFVFGFIRPKIYLPAGLNIEERAYILLHEQTHIDRKDHIIKLFAFLILSIHWFNTLVWIAFILMSKDMELSCDERVLKEMDEGIKKPYANSLLSLAAGRRIFNGSPLAFGEGNVKGRIKNVLDYKKPRFWIVAVSAVIVVVVCVGLLTNPESGGALVANPRTDSEQKEEEPTDVIVGGPIENDIAEYISYDSTNRSVYIAGLKIFEEFGTKEFGFSNEGSSTMIEDENALIFSMTIATGSITGALDGPTVYFKMDLDTNQILEKEFGPAPNYEELGMTEFIGHSGEVIEISDERMVEIGLYFKDFILHNEASSFEQTIEEKLTDIVNPKNKEISLSSNPYDYIKAEDSKDDYKYIVSQGEKSLNYMLNKFANSNSNGLQEYIMAIACSEILKEDAASKDWTTGRQWYENYLKSNQQKHKQQGLINILLYALLKGLYHRNRYN